MAIIALDVPREICAAKKFCELQPQVRWRRVCNLLVDHGKQINDGPVLFLNGAELDEPVEHGRAALTCEFDAGADSDAGRACARSRPTVTPLVITSAPLCICIPAAT